MVCYDVHVSVGSRLIGYFFLKILKADISKKMNFLFSHPSARRTARRLAMDIYGLITPPVAVPNGSAEPLGQVPETWREMLRMEHGDRH
jgi:hypothetical protein